MIRYTRNLLSFLVAVLVLTGCMSFAAGTAGIQPTEKTIAHTATAGSALATEAPMTSTRVASATAMPTASPAHTALPVTTVPPMATPNATATATPTRPAPTSTLSPVATPTLEPPAIAARADANIRSGPGAAYPIIGGARAGDRLSVTGQAQGWWQIALAGRSGWIWGTLVAPNAAAAQVPEVTDIPSPPPSPTSLPPTVAPTAAPPPLGSSAPLPDLVVLGPETQYPVRARVVQGWDYEFVDLSAAYDIVVYRDVFGMLAHQIDDENIRRYYPNKRRLGANGPIRVTLVDAQPHPDAGCPGWGWAPERETYASDPLGLMQERCLVQHSLRPVEDGHGAGLLVGWSYSAGNTVAVGAYGPTGADWSTTYFAELIVWPASLGPADRPDFSQSLYQPLGAAHKEDGRWVWQDAFVQIVPAGR